MKYTQQNYHYPAVAMAPEIRKILSEIFPLELKDFFVRCRD